MSWAVFFYNIEGDLDFYVKNWYAFLFLFFFFWLVAWDRYAGKIRSNFTKNENVMFGWLCEGHKLLECLFSCFVDREVRVYFIDIRHFSTISPFYQVKMRNCGPYFHFRFYSMNGRSVITWNLTQRKSHRFPINCWLFALVNINLQIL